MLRWVTIAKRVGDMSFRPSVPGVAPRSVHAQRDVAAPFFNRLSAVLAVGMYKRPLDEDPPGEGEDQAKRLRRIISPRTMRSMRMFLETISPALEDAMAYEDPEYDDASEHEIYLLDELRKNKRGLDIPKIMQLLENDENHVQVMSALAYMKNYEMEMVSEIKRELQGEDKTEFNEIWDNVLTKWL